MSPKVVYTYFDVRARGELARLIMKAGGIDFEDNRVNPMDWPGELKTATPFHSLPVLTWDGEVIGQSMTIARFLAKKVGLDGKTDLEQAKCDAIVDQCVDVFPALAGMWFASDSTSFQPPDSPSRSEENKKAKGEDFFNNKLPQFLKIIDAHLKKNGGKWMVGNSMTWADLAVYHILSSAMDRDKFKDLPGNEMRENVPKDYPKIRELALRVRDVPEIKKWLDERPDNKF